MTAPTSQPTSQSQGPPYATGASQTDTSQIEHWTTAGSVHGPLTKREAEAVIEREQVTVADSNPLGLLALACATFTLSAVFADWFGLTGAVVAIPVLLVMGGLGPLLAGMWAFRRGDALGATAWTLFGVYYAVLALVFWLLATHLLASALAADSVRGTLGIFMVIFSLVVLGLGGAALLASRLLAALFLGLGVAYLFDGLGIWLGPSDWLVSLGEGQSGSTPQNWLLILGGYVGLVAALLAIYLAVAIVVNSAAEHEIIPVDAARARGR